MDEQFRIQPPPAAEETLPSPASAAPPSAAGASPAPSVHGSPSTVGSGGTKATYRHNRHAYL